MARGLIGAGAKVLGGDVNADGLRALSDEIGSDSLSTVRLDISKNAECTAAVATAVRDLGRLDVLINNGALGMGAIRDDHFTKLVSIDEVTPAMWDRFVAVNLSGGLLCKGHPLGATGSSQAVDIIEQLRGTAPEGIQRKDPAVGISACRGGPGAVGAIHVYQRLEGD